MWPVRQGIRHKLEAFFVDFLDTSEFFPGKLGASSGQQHSAAQSPLHSPQVDGMLLIQRGRLLCNFLQHCL